MSEQHQPRRPRGLAAMSPERRREIARQGGKASTGGPRGMSKAERHELASRASLAALRSGKSHRWTSEEAREAQWLAYPQTPGPTVYRRRDGKLVERREVRDA